VSGIIHDYLLGKVMNRVMNASNGIGMKLCCSEIECCCSVAAPEKVSRRAMVKKFRAVILVDDVVDFSDSAVTPGKEA